jgi:hypothetical protein
MANVKKLADKKISRVSRRRHRRSVGEPDDHIPLSVEETTDADQQAADLAERRLSLPARQTLAHTIGQQQGNGRLQRLIAGVQRKQVAVQRKKKVKPTISTPVGKEAKKLKTGAAQLIINGVIVTILPDKTSKNAKLAGRAETNVNLDWGKLPGYQHRSGVVTGLDDKCPPIRMTIQTTYGVGAQAQDPSAYGRGTTEEDKQVGNTTLGFHEGQHGLNYLQYLKDNPLPKFLGKVGMNVEAYKAAMTAYQQETQDYSVKMGEESQAKTDCVGTQASFCVIE